VTRRAVFFDRDGVLNRAIIRDGKPYSPDSLAEFEIMPEAEQVLHTLRELGFLLIVITNQPDVARGKQTREQIEQMHSRLRARLPLDDIFVCYHDNQDACDCRKPRPGLLLQAALKYSLDLPTSFFVGDRWRDVDAGRAAGCRVVLIDYGYRERPPSDPPDVSVASLSEAVRWIVQNQ
jgi:D-glycero-D-manno-heptose 1,7-bisphosphate phosphatase